MARATDVFPNGEADLKIVEVKSWLKSRGVRDFEPVSLFADQLTKVSVFSDFGDHFAHSGSKGHCGRN
jgi:hypothetical protein